MEKRKRLRKLKTKNYYNNNTINRRSTSCVHEETLSSDLQLRYSRLNSISPSSGYGSIYGGTEDDKSIKSNVSTITNDNSPNSGSQLKNNLSKSQSFATMKDSLKRRYSQTSLSTTNSSSPSLAETNKKRRRSHCDVSRAAKEEYIIENIESIESVNANPVFFVKWLNYPSDQNTWESIDNLKDCLILEEYIENRYNLFSDLINNLATEIDMEIEKERLVFDTTNLSMKTLDDFDPLKLKANFIIWAQFRKARSRNVKEQEKLRKIILEMTLLKPFHCLRKQQMQEIKEFQDRMNIIECDAPINVENNVDLEVPEPGFVYIKESFPGKDVKPYDETPVGCSCLEGKCQPSTKCCARLAGNYFAYEKSGRLRIQTGEAIYECNKMCSCDDSCPNRVIQKGRKNSLCLFKTSNGCGWGVRTEKPIRKGIYVCEYVGEVITCETANERGKLYDAKGRTYLFDLDYNTTQESMYTIDAAMYGNISHFINHSCDPNLAVFPYWINNLDINMPGLAFFTLRAIEAGEELTFDYIRSDLEEKGEDNIYENLSDAEKVSCRCGAKNCRKVLF